MFEGQLAAKATEVGVEVFIAVLSVAAAYAVYYLHRAAAHIKSKTDLMKDRAKAEVIWRATQKLDDVVTREVEKLEQTVAGELRQMVKSGAVGREQLLQLGDKAYKEVVSALGPETLLILQECFGDYAAHVKRTIEAKVYQLKQMQAQMQA